MLLAEGSQGSGNLAVVSIRGAARSICKSMGHRFEAAVSFQAKPSLATAGSRAGRPSVVFEDHRRCVDQVGVLRCC